MTVTTAHTLVQLSLVSFKFVDDTHLLTTVTPGESVTSLTRRAQLKLTDWQKRLEITGGALKREKCYWYLVAFKWRTGQWKYGTERDFPGIL